VLAIGKAGAVNAAILATQILSGERLELREAIERHRAEQAERILAASDPSS
jgi:5-(carboxyamino)imidazole ribonucleotide mutase